ncbi:MAG: undecaprenyl-diphosphate phosphatase [Thermomicrobiales bacterium]
MLEKGSGRETRWRGAMSLLHAIVISLLQGAFELFPVSSLGHTVLVPALLGWDEWKAGDPHNASFVAFVVVLHLGTAVALLTFFWRDWLWIIAAVLRSVGRRALSDDPDEHFGWLIAVGTIPAGIIGFLLQTPLKDLFSKPVLVAIFLVLNGVMMLAGERLRRRQQVTVAAGDGTVATMTRGKEIADVGFREGIGVGTAQALALLPGFSRSGATITAGLLTGLRHEAAARFSFMLATPIILAAGVLEVPKLFKADANIGLGIAAMGFVISGVTAYLAVRFLVKYFETERLDPFGYYCIAFGIICLAIFGIRAVM